ncbi:hypothetical protein C7444_110100 [Sphaerotilus hippei]|uniref:TonB family protein n=1 Tax=Sphaerotilus hippei TaxID=744406 RepID=A0A318H1K0_9BURK|nr:hypothetical protein [Sphaerotilus hippei]PXW95255.1 hypothetical protein C7444_110100 [Sphaerotilus hippei]
MHCVESKVAAPGRGRRGRGPAALRLLLVAGLAALAGCGTAPERGGSSEAAGSAYPERSGAPRAASWAEYRVMAGRRLVAMNPRQTHDGEVEQPALAIPVLRIQLESDGSVRKVEVVRRPGQAADTTQIAIDAVRRAAPFGPVAHLPGPWEFTEVFLFNEDRRFKPAVLDR